MDQERFPDEGVGATDPQVGATDPQVDVDDEASQEVMSLLSQHVPLALLADLAMPDGPASPEILSEEGLPEVAWWEAEETGDASDTRATPSS